MRFQGHAAPVYSIIKLNNSQFATSGEEHNIFIWGIGKKTLPMVRIDTGV